MGVGGSLEDILEEMIESILDEGWITIVWDD